MGEINLFQNKTKHNLHVHFLGCTVIYLGPFLLIWFNLNPGMYK